MFRFKTVSSKYWNNVKKTWREHNFENEIKKSKESGAYSGICLISDTGNDLTVSTVDTLLI